MQKVTRFRCDVCGREYADACDAEACETRCKCRYMRYCVIIVPYKGTFESSVLLVTSYTGKPEVEVYIGDDGEGHEQKTFNIIVPTNIWTEDCVRERMAAVIKAQCGSIMYKLHEF